MLKLDPVQSWHDMWRNAGRKETHADVLERLCGLYSAPDRHYHTLEHIGHCLSVFQRMRSDARRPLVVQLAIWFHDAVLDTKRGDNEVRSAELFREVSDVLALDQDTRILVSQTILSTTHKVEDRYADRDTFLMLDIDLSSLGATKKVFKTNTAEIRREYPHLSDRQNDARQREVYRFFLERPAIYMTSKMNELYEKSARKNLEEALRALS